MSNNNPTPKSSKTKRWTIIFVIEVLLIIILIPVVYLYSELSKINTADNSVVDKSHIVINEDVDAATSAALSGYINIALFGVDSRDGSMETGSRSDSMIICSINADTKEVKLVSVYRDTCLNVPDWGYTKATHAYAYGGAELAMSMLNRNLDLDITEFATVDFAVLADIIDSLGGLEIDITEAEVEQINKCVKEQNRVTGSNSPYVEHAGLQLLDGTQATGYARIRKIDSDFARSDRQRKVLSLMFDKAKKADLRTLLNIVDTVLPEVYTNLSSNQIISLAKDALSYELVDSQGWPFEKATGSYDGLSYVFAEGLQNNVSQLHQFLFNNDSYAPSATVTEINDALLYRTGH